MGDQIGKEKILQLLLSDCTLGKAMDKTDRNDIRLEGN